MRSRVWASTRPSASTSTRLGARTSTSTRTRLGTSSRHISSLSTSHSPSLGASTHNRSRTGTRASRASTTGNGAAVGVASTTTTTLLYNYCTTIVFLRSVEAIKAQGKIGSATSLHYQWAMEAEDGGGEPAASSSLPGSGLQDNWSCK